MVFIVLRHGESEWNKENKFTGWTDVSLSQNGIKEAQQVKELLKKYSFHVVFTSELKRTVETADIILKDAVVSVSKISDKALNERDYGELTGKNKDEIKKEYGETKLNMWRRSYYEQPPGGESLDDVKQRVGTYFDSTILPFIQQEKNVLVIAHGNSLRALFVHLDLKNNDNIEYFEISTGIPIQIDVANCQFSYENKYQLVGTQIIDSRGFPTIEVACFDKLLRTFVGKGSSPSGASCGSSEVLELRDNNPDLFKGKSVFKCIENLDIINSNMLLDFNTITNLQKCDLQLIDIDNTPLKTCLGGNTTTAVSFCLADTASKLLGLEMFEYISKIYQCNSNNSNNSNNINNSNNNNTFNRLQLPTPFVNIINGGKHSVTGELKIQEFMIFTREDISVSKKIQIICEVYHTLQKLLVSKYGSSAKSIGDEGGFCPPIYNTEEAFQIIEESIKLAGYLPNTDVFLALDCAASEFYDEDTGLYEIEKDVYLDKEHLINYYEDLLCKYPALKSIEDGFHETDYDAWTRFTLRNSDKIMIVGDDLFTTNPKLIKTGLTDKWANALLLKVNQIGTITEAIEGAKLMFKDNKNVIVSHRSGETNHAYMVDIAVGIGAKYLKIGSPCRGERVAKFNRLIEIDNYLQYKMN